MGDQYRHYYGYCDECEVLVQVEVGPDSWPDKKLPAIEEWTAFGLVCPVCNNTVPGGYDGADNVTTEDRLSKWMLRTRVAEQALERRDEATT